MGPSNVDVDKPLPSGRLDIALSEKDQAEPWWEGRGSQSIDSKASSGWGGENGESGSTPFADSGDVSWGSDESGDETVAQDAAKARKKRVKARAVEKLAAMDYDAEEIAEARTVVRQARAKQERRRIHREYKGIAPVDEEHEGEEDD